MGCLENLSSEALPVDPLARVSPQSCQGPLKETILTQIPFPS